MNCSFPMLVEIKGWGLKNKGWFWKHLVISNYLLLLKPATCGEFIYQRSAEILQRELPMLGGRGSGQSLSGKYSELDEGMCWPISPCLPMVCTPPRPLPHTLLAPSLTATQGLPKTDSPAPSSYSGACFLITPHAFCGMSLECTGKSASETEGAECPHRVPRLLFYFRIKMRTWDGGGGAGRWGQRLLGCGENKQSQNLSEGS